jgi:hypothetical protein
MVGWRGYRGEPLVLALVALTALTVLNGPNSQDISRLALTQSVAEEKTLTIDRYAEQTIDKALYGGHAYTDKAPGLSFAALLPYAGVREVQRLAGRSGEQRDVWESEVVLWLVRLSTVGAFFVLAVFLVGRAAEALAAGTGALTAVAFGLGTHAHPLATISFGHDVAAALAVGSFLLVWFGGVSPRSALAFTAGGLLAGLAVLAEYQAALAAIVVLGYTSWRGGARATLLFVLGALPAAVALGAYNLAAFDSPFHLSYRYVSEMFVERQREGLFGISIPDAEALAKVLVGHHGLILSPFLVLAVVGLWLLWQQGMQAEAAACAGIAALFLIATAGYFDPYGGKSPGPRFFVPALPFLCVGLAPAARRWPRLAILLVAISVLALTYVSATWELSYGALRFQRPPPTIWSYLGAPTWLGLALLFTTAAAATVFAGRQLLITSPDATGVRRGLRRPRVRPGT